MHRPFAPSKKGSDPWLGPHFYCDLVRLARKGWPTLTRVLYLVALLVALTVMYRTQGDTVELRRLSEFAEHARAYAYTLIVLQNILVLVLLPVYVASAIAEEKENQTLEALTLTHLTDRELVLGKLSARLLTLGAVVLSSFPILAFMHLWGNVEIDMLLYHEANTFLLLISAGSVCIWVSTRSDSTFQAISGSYAWLALLGFVSLITAFILPMIFSAIATYSRSVPGGLTASYWPVLLPLVLGHGFLTWLTLKESIGNMEYLRRVERVPQAARKTTGSMALTDNAAPATKPGKRGQVRSRIHPWAWPIDGDALFWKECIKDGTTCSLSLRWLLWGVGVVAAGAVFYYFLYAIASQEGRAILPMMAYNFSLTTYVVSLAAYALVVLFQTTMCVAGEREHDTLTMLLLVPADRPEILFTKWIGPWWRNWPILAIACFGIAIGIACGIYGPLMALTLLLLPWPTLLMLSGLALWLSVLCRRVLFANTAVVGILGMLFVGHLALGRQTGIMLSFWTALIADMPLKDVIGNVTWSEAALLALGEQACFLLVGVASTAWSFRIFGKRDYASH